MILATRFGFHGKKGLADAVTGSEEDRDRDPRVRFISFPREECADVQHARPALRPHPLPPGAGGAVTSSARLTALITEPYLGGGGSYHPPTAYLQLLQPFCRQHDLVFILDEVQSNFGRTGDLFAFETYGIEPDIVVLGKGLGNGVPVAAAVGRTDLFASLDYGEGSDTWSANPLASAAVLATLETSPTTICSPTAAGPRPSSRRACCGSRSSRSSPTSAARRAAWCGAWKCATTPAQPPPTGRTPSCSPATAANRTGRGTAFTCWARWPRRCCASHRRSRSRRRKLRML